MKVEFLEADIHYIHGVLGSVAPLGLGVQPHGTDQDRLILANGTAGYQLQREIVEERNILDIVLPVRDGLPQSFSTPHSKTATVAARRVTRMQLEGNDLILASGTGAVSSVTAVGTALGYVDGRLRVKQGSDEVAFIVRRQLAAEDTANPFRLEVERP